MTSAPRFSVFGYSFTGAFALWLAHLTGRVDAVVSGDFPIAGDYSPLYPEIQALSAAAEADPAAWADLNSRFDNRAALAFYRELSDSRSTESCRNCHRISWSATCHARCSRSGARTTRRSPGEEACDCSPPGWTVAGSSTRPSPVTTTKACWPISMRRYRASWPGSTACPARSERWVSRNGTLAKDSAHPACRRTARAHSSVEEHSPYKRRVTGSNPVAPTRSEAI